MWFQFELNAWVPLSMASSVPSSSGASSAPLYEDSDPLDPGLLEDLKAAGANEGKVEEFFKLLKECNVGTRGALGNFQESLPAMVDMLYDVETPLGKLQATGFLAALRVRLSPHPAPRSHPFNIQRTNAPG